jgi:predicted DNA binding CopG/RHH family protein
MTKNAKKRIGRGGIEIEDLGEIEISPEEDAAIQKRVDHAEAELTATSVNFRWHKQQLSVVKRIAEMMGVSYQTYIKMVVYKQALVDLQMMTGQAVKPNKAQKTAAERKPSTRNARTRQRA